jgi:hypothetical protein
MTAIYELYDALLTIKDYCVSKDNTCEDCHSLIVMIAVFL